MLWLTSIVAMTITATRIHRYLTDFVSETTDVYDVIPITYFSALTVVDVVVAGTNPHNVQTSVQMSSQTATALIFLQNCVEVAMHTTCEQYYQTLWPRHIE